MRMMTLGTAFTLLAFPAMASDYQSAMQAYLEENIRSWSQAPVLVEAISTQNTETQAYDQGQVDALDKTWRAEVGDSASQTINRVMNNAAADFLREQVTQSGGRITEVFIMDAQGLNVAASHLTSDMWQGDEAKFQKTYSLGVDAIHFGEVELDESTRRYQAQISLTITNADGAAIGAMTVGVDAEALM